MNEIQVNNIGNIPLAYSANLNITQAAVSTQANVKRATVVDEEDSLVIQDSSKNVAENGDDVQPKQEITAHEALVSEANMELLRGNIQLSTFLTINANPHSPPFVPLSWSMRDIKDGISLYI